jgi:hypothetical protein
MRPYEGHPEPTIFYAAQLGNSYFVLTTSKREFRDISRALTVSTDDDLRTFDGVDFAELSGHQYWGYRLVRRDGSSDAEAAALNQLGANIRVLSIFGDISKRQMVVRVVGRGTEDMSSSPLIMPGTTLPQRFHATASGVWETTFPLTQDHAGSETIAQLLYTLGFGIVF